MPRKAFPSMAGPWESETKVAQADVVFSHPEENTRIK
jgi:hypothetical protein